MCVLVAGMYGARSVGFKLFLFQGLPAFIALVALMLI